MIILTFRNMKKDIETLLDQALTGQLLERPQVEELRCSFHSIGGAAALPAILHADRHKKAAWRGCGFACDPPCQPSQEVRSSMLTTLSSTPTGVTVRVAF